MLRIAMLGDGPLLAGCVHSLSAHGEVLAVESDVARWTGQGWHIEDRVHDVLVTLNHPGEPAAGTDFVGEQGRSLRTELEHGRLYRGVQRSGYPNLFVVRDAAARTYTEDCLGLLSVTGARRIDVRASVQAYADRPGSRSDWPRSARRRGPFRGRPRRTVGVAGHPCRDDLWLGYDAPGLLDPDWTGAVQIRRRTGEDRSPYIATGRLSGAFQPTDGRYHWQGSLSPVEGVRPGTDAEVRIDQDTWISCRITEVTPWGLRVAGHGAPPFPLTPLEIGEPVA